MFVTVGEWRYNIDYIKEITPNFITVANTEASGSTRMLYDRTIEITKEQYSSIIEQLDYPNIIQKLKEENERLKLELLYRPGGSGYMSAKSEFESLK